MNRSSVLGEITTREKSESITYEMCSSMKGMTAICARNFRGRCHCWAMCQGRPSYKTSSRTAGIDDETVEVRETNTLQIEYSRSLRSFTALDTFLHFDFTVVRHVNLPSKYISSNDTSFFPNIHSKLIVKKRSLIKFWGALINKTPIKTKVNDMGRHPRPGAGTWSHIISHNTHARSGRSCRLHTCKKKGVLSEDPEMHLLRKDPTTWTVIWRRPSRSTMWRDRCTCRHHTCKQAFFQRPMECLAKQGFNHDNCEWHESFSKEIFAGPRDHRRHMRTATDLIPNKCNKHVKLFDKQDCNCEAPTEERGAESKTLPSSEFVVIQTDTQTNRGRTFPSPCGVHGIEN